MPAHGYNGVSGVTGLFMRSSSLPRSILSLCERTGWRMPGIAMLWLTLLVIYAGLAFLASGGDQWWQLAWAGGFYIFSGDDAYRFFLARAAWLEPGLYNQGFVLPVALLLDGSLAALFQDHLVSTRVVKGAISLFALYLLFRTARLLEVRLAWALLGTILLACMPLYLWTSMSFYGEAWLVVLVCMAGWATASNRSHISACVVALMPLVRPEGIFWLIPALVQRVWRRDYPGAAIMLLPGTLYFVFLLLAPGGLDGFFSWRLELRAFLNKIAFSSDPMAFFGVVSGLWILVGLLGGLQIRMRQLWPWVIGGYLWVAQLGIAIGVLGKADFESRYVVPALPVLALTFAVGLDWLAARTARHAIAARTGLCILLVWIMLVHLQQVTPARLLLDFRREAGEWPHFQSQSMPTAVFGYYNAEGLDNMAVMARFIENTLIANPRIDVLVVADTNLFYFLRPDVLPAPVTVGYSASFWPYFKRLLGNEILAVFPGGDQKIAYYSIAPPEFSGKPLLLYVDRMNQPDYPHSWYRGAHQAYLFEYESARHSSRDISLLPVIDPSTIPPAELRWR